MSDRNDEIRVALPRGDLREPLAERLEAAGFVPEGYGSGSRTYRFEVTGRPGVIVRVFSDQDIPIQVALGHYDIGITSRCWVDELLVRYQHDQITPLRPLDVGQQRLVLAAAPGTDLATLAAERTVRVATEYPNLAHYALNRLRVPNYRVLDVWGNAHAWAPDDADLVLVTDEAARAEGLVEVMPVHAGPASVIANARSLADRDLAAALEPLLSLPAGPRVGGPEAFVPLGLPLGPPPVPAAMPERETLRIAVPDGHAQRHTVAALADAGIAFAGYEERHAERRPTSDIPGVEVKVIRPQDMPRAVALGLFDLAMTGRDWLFAHLATHPASPVAELCDLRRSLYSLGAVVPEALPAETITEAIAYWRRDDPDRPIRVASEYASLADHYARARHLGRYRVIPISGASEGFVPEDAEILIEGTETGNTLRANQLRMIDVIMTSTNCVIGHRTRPAGRRGELRDELVARLGTAAAKAAE